MIQDTHHPTLLGQVALAQAVLRELARKKVLRMLVPAQRVRSTRRCAPRHFGMDAEQVGDDVRADERALSACGRVSVRSDRTSGEIAAVCRGGGADQERRGARARGDSGNGTGRTCVAGDGGIGWRIRETAARHAERGRPHSTGEIRAVRGHSGTRSTCQSWSRTVALRPRNRTDAAKWSPISALDHLADEAGQGTVHDSHRGADRNRGLFGDEEARVDHRVDLLKVASQSILIGDFEDGDEPVSAERDQPILVVPLQEHVAGKEGHDRLDPPSLRRAAFFSACGR